MSTQRQDLVSQGRQSMLSYRTRCRHSKRNDATAKMIAKLGSSSSSRRRSSSGGGRAPFSALLLVILTVISTFPRASWALAPPLPLQPRLSYRAKIDPEHLALGALLGNGTFGSVRYGTLQIEGTDVDVVIKTPALNQKALNYFDTEAYLNQRLCQNENGRHVVAPCLGECVMEGARYLVWKASGHETLEDGLQLRDYETRMSHLATALQVSPSDNRHAVARELLQQLLASVSYCHSLGIVHRDIKPANILVDAKDGCLRLIEYVFLLIYLGEFPMLLAVALRETHLYISFICYIFYCLRLC